MSALDLRSLEPAGGPTVRAMPRLDVPARVLLLGSAGTVALIVLATLDPGGAGWLYELGHWNLAGLTATLAAALAARPAAGVVRQVRLGAAVAFLLWALGMLTWAVLVLADCEVVPSLADVFSAAFILPGAWMLWTSVHERLSGTDELALYLDDALVGLATVTVILGIHGPEAYAVGGITGLLVVAYPALFIGAGLASLIAVLSSRQPVSLGGGVAFGIGALATGVAWGGWVLPTATGGELDPTFNALFSLGPLVCAYGAITWTGEQETRPNVLRVARALDWAYGPAALAVIALATSVGHDRPVRLEEILHLILIAATVLLLARTASHLRQRGEMVRELEATRVENEHLIGRLRTELVERERAQQRLVDASRMAAVGELAAAVAHEVNNPLTSVLGYADLLLATTEPDAPHRGELMVIRAEAIRVRDRVRSLLDFATPRRPEVVASDLAEVVALPLELLRYHLDRGGVRVHLLAEPMDPVELDVPAMQQVLVNLLSTIAGGMAGGGRIQVVTRPVGERAGILLEVDRADLDESLLAGWVMPFEDAVTALGGSVRDHAVTATVSVLRAHGGTIVARRTASGHPEIEITLPFRQPGRLLLLPASDGHGG
jgi:signal transduction histidine kinase